MKRILALTFCLAACSSEPTADVTDATSDAASDGSAADAGVDNDVDTDASDGSAAVPRDFDAQGPYAVGFEKITLGQGEGVYPAIVFAPADTGAGVVELPSFADSDAHAASLSTLLDAAPVDCPTRQLDMGTAGATVVGEVFPLVVFSHCYGCTAFATASVLTRIASHGFVVVGVEHPGTTLWNNLDGTMGNLDATQLAARTAQVTGAIDYALGLAVVDGEHIGLIGHSFGAITVGNVTGVDDRVDAVVTLGAPIESPLFAGPTVAAVDVPLMMVLLREDNSITEIGNNFIRSNFEAANPPAWLAEIADAGHWSVSDLAGLTEDVMPGCGTAERQTDPGTEFDYLPVADGIAITAGLATRFFAAHLQGDPAALLELDAPSDARVEVTAR